MSSAWARHGERVLATSAGDFWLVKSQPIGNGDFVNTWKTPKGDLSLARWKSMTDSDEQDAVVEFYNGYLGPPT